MQKIIVIGCPGSGKSHFSKELHKVTHIPLHHLDMMFWNSDKTTVAKEIFRSRLDEVLLQEQWIIDGNYEREYWSLKDAKAVAEKRLRRIP